MKANVTIANLYWNRSLSNFFFREQSYKTFEELVNKSNMSVEQTLDFLDAQTEDLDLDDVEEDFYSLSVEELAEQFNIELVEEDDDE